MKIAHSGNTISMRSGAFTQERLVCLVPEAAVGLNENTTDECGDYARRTREPSLDGSPGS